MAENREGGGGGGGGGGEGGREREMERAKNKQLILEDYLGFFENPSTEGLVMDQLNKILSIHGLCRRKTKSEVIEVVKILEVMDPKRCTLKDCASVYPCAPLSLDDVKADVRSLGWEECPLGSIMAVGSAVEKVTPSSKNLSRSIGIRSAEKRGNLSRQISAADASTSASAAPGKGKKRGRSVAKILAHADVAALESAMCAVKRGRQVNIK